ncbi:hypothetical protein [Streptomyces sp. NPDC090080]|uniref:hypothetical protein n=1 Tax=Streptomyces sp. NPDC090080 TaxID=3365939 RepID=UPI00380BD7A1
MPAFPTPAASPANGTADLETAAAAVTAAQQALQTAPRNLTAAIMPTGTPGGPSSTSPPVPDLDPVTMRNILAVTPAKTPDSSSSVVPR